METIAAKRSQPIALISFCELDQIEPSNAVPIHNSRSARYVQIDGVVPFFHELGLEPVADVAEKEVVYNT